MYMYCSIFIVHCQLKCRDSAVLLDLSEKDMYIHELKVHHALASIDHTMKNFVVQLFSSKTKTLMVYT